MRARLASSGDHAAAAIIDIILRDEPDHVAIEQDDVGALKTGRVVQIRKSLPALSSTNAYPIVMSCRCDSYLSEETFIYGANRRVVNTRFAPIAMQR